MSYEYELEAMPWDNDLRTKLKSYGQDGWRLIAAINPDHSKLILCIFERRRENGEENAEAIGKAKIVQSARPRR